jgi:hypothetical protein
VAVVVPNLLRDEIMPVPVCPAESLRRRTGSLVVVESAKVEREGVEGTPAPLRRLGATIVKTILGDILSQSGDRGCGRAGLARGPRVVILWRPCLKAMADMGSRPVLGSKDMPSTQPSRGLQCPPFSESPSQLSGAQRGPMAEITNVETGLEGGRTSRALMIPHLLTSLGDVLARCATKLGANPVPKQGGGAGESGPHAGINGCLKKSNRSTNTPSAFNTKVKIQ